MSSDPTVPVTIQVSAATLGGALLWALGRIGLEKLFPSTKAEPGGAMLPQPGGNGKSYITSTQLNEALDRTRDGCDRVSGFRFDEMAKRFDRVEEGQERISTTLNHVNVVLSENISNHSARIQGLERAVEDLRDRIG